MCLVRGTGGLFYKKVFIPREAHNILFEEDKGDVMSKVCIYLRTSTDKQQTGMEAQRRAIMEYCKLRSISDYIIYEDFGVSGTKSTRPQLDLMMAKIRSGVHDTLIVYSFSRFARSTQFLINSLEEFNQLKVNFISLSENIDLSTAIGKAMFTIISAIATLERDLISERVKNGLRNARAKGKQLGRRRIVNRELILSLRDKGFTYRQIAEALNVSHGAITLAIRERLTNLKK